MARNVNAAGLTLVKEFEGLYLKAYRCPAGVWTIGYGHTKDVTPGMTIPAAEADALLAADLAEAGVDVLATITVPLNDNQFAALVSFTFNVGAGSLRSSTLRKKLNAGGYAAVPDQIKRWDKATVNGEKKQLPGLVRRRAAEAVLFLQPPGRAAGRELTMPQRVER